MLYLQFLLLAVLSRAAFAAIRAGGATDTYKNCMKHPPRRKDGYVSISDEEHDWNCMQLSFVTNATRHGIHRNASEEQIEYIKQLTEDVFKDRVARQAVGGQECAPKQVRKEYRTLTDQERLAYHNALRSLKNGPEYDALANLHVGNPGAHGGPAFFNWHRIYLLIFERALQRKDPSVTLPYWASSWDNEMSNPQASIMWDARFAGNGFGTVTSGPAANWPSPVMLLTRNVGSSGGLITQQDIDNVMSQNTLEQIADRDAAPQNNLERHHNKVHVYVGGQMGQLSTAPFDPVFYMHHAFIDCIYEQFRLKQIADGRNPDNDWPRTYPRAHGPRDPISLVPQIDNIDVSQRRYACATYEPTCIQLIRCDCNSRCPSRYLSCDRERQICVPIEGRGGGGDSGEGDGGCCGQSGGYGYGGGSNGGGRYRPPYGDYTYRPPNNQYRPPSGGGSRSGGNSGVQNTYCIDEYRCDTSLWSYVPLQINVYRPPDQATYNSYPVRNGRPDTQYDIYNGRAYGSNNVYVQNEGQMSQSPAYTTNCGCRSTSGGVYVQSRGNTYEGSYREYQPVDRRMPVTSTTSYVAVMNPEYGTSDSMIRVYDECGRMCRPRCRYTDSGPYTDCDGSIEITVATADETRPYYASNYEQATRLVYDYIDVGGGRQVPTYNADRVSMIYDCDYRGGWPWDQKASQSYDRSGYGGDTAYLPPVYEDPKPYVRRRGGGYY